jgi:hypothetical protein
LAGSSFSFAFCLLSRYQSPIPEKQAHNRCKPYLLVDENFDGGYMRNRIKLAVWFGLLAAPALAQADSCPAIVKSALDATQGVCTSISRNQACYGNVRLEAEARAGAGDFNFTQPGDLADLAILQSLRLSALDAQANTWGVALMKVQANLPKTLPGQNVTFVLFGNVELQNAVESNTQAVTLQVTAKRAANIRRGASKDAPVIDSAKAGDALTADGRSKDGAWLRVQLPDGTGWVSAPLVSADGDIQTLSIVEASKSALNPMQAFYFKSGSNDAPCEEAPDSGILIQTPQGAGKIQLTVDDAEITLGSTAYIKADPDHFLEIYMIEGSGQVRAAGVTRPLLAGTRVCVPLDSNGRASGPPGDPEGYDAARMAVLPISLLERQITVTPPLSTTQVQAALAKLTAQTSTSPSSSSAAPVKP